MKKEPEYVKVFWGLLRLDKTNKKTRVALLEVIVVPTPKGLVMVKGKRLGTLEEFEDVMFERNVPQLPI